MITTRHVSSSSSVFLAAVLITSPAEAQPGEPAAPADPALEMTFGRQSTTKAEPVPAHPPGTALPGPVPAPGRATARPRTMEDVSEAVTEEMTIRNMRWRYSLNFFGDISLSAIRPVAVGDPFGFSLGAQDLLIRGELSNHITATTEIALEPGDAGVTVDVERFAVRWQSAGYFIEAGRTHTAFGYWNNAYHHGRWLQPTIARPRWVAFEDDGGILPVHWVGAGAGARVPVGTATVNLQANVGNGRGQIVDDVRNAHDYQAMKAFLVSAEAVGIGVPELRAGIAGVYDKIPALDDRLLLPPGTPISEYIVGAHVAYVNVPLLFIGEGYWVAHTAPDLNQVTHQFNTYGGFVLVGYAFGRTTPYVEVERIASKGVDPFFVRTDLGEPDSFNSLQGILGVRVDLTDWTALKAEYRQTKQWDKDVMIYAGVLNWSWGF